ncbi:MAG: nucleotidyltransferase family protein [Chlamydiae bacterium]|nr:nucleotidyltransferase family protein [Chlamydiota bacterium]MBI3265750.1 nucleotidyltransferase family protein [Chlamydiota bacterium]
MNTLETFKKAENLLETKESAFSNEHRFMLSLLSGNPSETEQIEWLIHKRLSWLFFTQEALRNNVGPLLWQEISHSSIQDLIPEKAKEILKSDHERTAVSNLLLFQETRKVVQTLQENSIPVLLLKGAFLAPEVYRNIALRPCADTDILIRWEDFSRIKKTLPRLGFSLSPRLMSESFYHRHHFHIPFLKLLKLTTVHIEVHWNLMDKYLLQGLQISEVWRRARPFTFEGLPALTLSPEDELIYLALHILKHGFMNRWIAADQSRFAFLFQALSENKLIWFMDLKKILESSTVIDWNLLIERTQRWNVSESIRPIFKLLSLLFPSVPFPKSLLRIGQPFRVSREREIFFKMVTSKSNSHWIQKHLLSMNGNLQFRPIRVLDILEYFFLPQKTLIQCYRLRSKFQIFFYYPFHFLKTLCDSISGLVEWAFFRLTQRWRKP